MHRVDARIGMIERSLSLIAATMAQPKTDARDIEAVVAKLMRERFGS